MYTFWSQIFYVVPNADGTGGVGTSRAEREGTGTSEVQESLLDSNFSDKAHHEKS